MTFFLGTGVPSLLIPECVRRAEINALFRTRRYLAELALDEARLALRRLLAARDVEFAIDGAPDGIAFTLRVTAVVPPIGQRVLAEARDLVERLLARRPVHFTVTIAPKAVGFTVRVRPVLPSLMIIAGGERQ